MRGALRFIALRSADEFHPSHNATHSFVPPLKVTRHRSVRKDSIDSIGKMDQITNALEPCKQFAKDSMRLVKRCTKPDRKEFQKIALATAIGFAIMGFIGFFVKLIHIPINNIIVQ